MGEDDSKYFLVSTAAHDVLCLLVLVSAGTPSLMRTDHGEFAAIALFRLRVVERLVLVILQHGTVFIQMHQVVAGEERNFPSAAGRIDHEVRDRHSAGVALEGLDDVQAGFYRRAEMVGALG